ncbi:unnamed protein product [Hermetia illucens]|uniref:Transposable element P transposase-like GTP-binding insertion domain-containing protein n=1 Tax=Hermetia illucens TaxID=343691 RepID=A0A7R8UJM0_HERIL|nr:unnamed protein product [Hermetia illucens]
MKVKLVTQVFSHSIAAGIYTTTSCNEISAKALEFLEDFDALFDICNSWKLFDSKKLRRAYKGTRNNHLNKMKALIESIKGLVNNERDVTTKVKCIKGWLISINSIEQILAALQSEEFKFLFTRNLNQVRTHVWLNKRRAKNHNPTPYQFTVAFKRLFSLKYLEILKTGTCEIQTEWTLPTVSLNIPNVRAAPPVIDTMPSVGGIHEMDINESNAFCYVGGYIYKRFQESHLCCKQQTFGNMKGAG